MEEGEEGGRKKEEEEEEDGESRKAGCNNERHVTLGEFGDTWGWESSVGLVGALETINGGEEEEEKEAG